MPQPVIDTMSTDILILGSGGAGLEAAQTSLAGLRQRAERVCVSNTARLNAAWQEWLNLDSMLQVSQMLVASALARQESRGSHYRSDCPGSAEDRRVHNVYVQRDGARMRLWPEPVTFTRLQPLNHTTSACEQVFLAHEGE